MKVLFTEAKSNLKEITLDKAIVAVDKYKKVGLVSTVQFLGLLPDVQKTLEKAGHQVSTSKPQLHAIKAAQLLGCDVTAIPQDCDCVLYVGTGEFHPFGIGLTTFSQKPFFKLNPFSGDVEKLSEKEIRKMQLQQQARIANFKAAKTIGILVTLKLGQNEMQGSVDKIKEKLEKEGKEVFVFIGDTLNPAEMENFPQIEAWVNTACPRVVDDQELYKKPVVNVVEALSSY